MIKEIKPVVPLNFNNKTPYYCPCMIEHDEDKEHLDEVSKNITILNDVKHIIDIIV